MEEKGGPAGHAPFNARHEIQAPQIIHQIVARARHPESSQQKQFLSRKELSFWLPTVARRTDVRKTRGPCATPFS